MPVSQPVLINSDFKLLDPFECGDDVGTLSNEPMFFNASLDFAYDKGGEITRAYLDAMPDRWKNSDAVFDSRTHMLMPGWWPAIPGYHHDDVPRRATSITEKFGLAAQPDYDTPAYEAEHIMGLVNAHVSPTIFAKGMCTMPAVADEVNVYGEWNKEVYALLAAQELLPVEAPNKQLIEFNWQSFHTAQQAKEAGWRWFGRASMNTERTGRITNQMRNQTQVYLEAPEAGW